MRIPRKRAVALISLVAASLACADQQDTATATAVRRSVAHLSLAPTFSASAAEAYTALARTGADVVSVHVVLRRLDGKVVYEGDIAFPPGQDQVTVDVPVEITGTEESLSATIELRDAAGVVQFGTTQQVTARDVKLPPTVPVALVMQYIGPGFDVKSLSVSPSQALVPPGATQALAVEGLDAAGKSVPSIAVSWASSDTNIAKVSPTSASTATVAARSARGTVTISATLPSGVKSASTVTFLPLATRMVVVSGNGQTGISNTFLSNQLVVEVQGSDGKPVSGREVGFRAVTADGNVGVSNGSSGADGRASTTLKLGRAAGSYQYEVSSGSLAPLSVSATATPAPVGPPTQIIPLNGFPSKFTIGQPIVDNFSAQLADANGAYVKQAGVAMTVTLVFTPGGSVMTVQSVSDSQGVFTLSIPAYNGAPGTASVTLTSPSMSNLPSGTFTVVK